MPENVPASVPVRPEVEAVARAIHDRAFEVPLSEVGEAEKALWLAVAEAAIAAYLSHVAHMSIRVCNYCDSPVGTGRAVVRMHICPECGRTIVPVEDHTRTVAVAPLALVERVRREANRRLMIAVAGEVAPLIAAEAAAQERERIIEALKAHAGAVSTLAYEWLGCWDAVEFIEGLPAPGTEETP